MPRRRNTGPGEPYTRTEAAQVAGAVAAAYVAWGRSAEPTAIDVRARIEWAGDDSGSRRTKLDIPHQAGEMRKLRQAVERLGRAHPAKSRDAKGWHAQLGELVEAKRGSAAADRAGLNPSARTLRKWLADEDYPIRSGDREKIARAYEELRNFSLNDAVQAVADALTDALKDRYGSNIRFRDIEHFDFE